MNRTSIFVFETPYGSVLILPSLMLRRKGNCRVSGHLSQIDMAVALPKGFKYLKITEWWTILLIVVPLGVSILDWKSYFMFAWDPFITVWKQFWRIPLLQMQFQNQSEVAASVILVIMKLKGLERTFGGLKLLKIIILLHVYNLVLITVVSFTFYHLLGWNLFIPSGPFGILFGLFYPYLKYTPITYTAEFDFSSLANFKPLGETICITVTDMFSCQVIYLLLFLSEGIPSMLVCAAGYFIGYLYFNNLVPFTDESLGLVDRYYYKLTKERDINEIRRRSNRMQNNASNVAVAANHNQTASNGL